MSVNAQTCDLTLYIDAENTKGYLRSPTVSAVSQSTSRRFNAVFVGENPVFKAVPPGIYKVTLSKSGFATHIGEIEVTCGRGPDRQVHANFTLCASEWNATFDEGRQASKDRNTFTLSGDPKFACRQHRLRPMAKIEEEHNSRAKWKEVVRNTEGTPYYIDIASFERNENFVRFRIKSESPNSTTFLTAFGNCIGRNLKLANRFAMYSFSRRLVALDGDDKAFDVQKGTIMEALLNFACDEQTDELPVEIPRPRPIPTQISGGVLNGKALILPKPPFPPAARAVRASGAVSVKVLIDEGGSVISASAISGHPLLHKAAEQAAFGAKFSPTTLVGQPVKVSGVITYNFVP